MCTILYTVLFICSCRKEADLDEVKRAILDDSIPTCKYCGGLVKPDIVFFGEMLPDRFHTLSYLDLSDAQLLICIGTSLEVYPFAGLADNYPYDQPRLLINRLIHIACNHNIHNFIRNSCIHIRSYS